MASGGMVSTYQRYINGVPIPPSRKTLRLREKYVVLLVFFTFGIVCFGAFFFLPDLRDRVNVDEFRRFRLQIGQAGGDMFVPQANIGGHKGEGDEVDIHQQQDKAELEKKMQWDEEHKKMMEKIRQNLELSESEHNALREDIQAEKQKLLDKQKEDQAQKAEDDKNQALNEVKEHEGVKIPQGNINLQPPSSETEQINKIRQETVKEVQVNLYVSYAKYREPRFLFFKNYLVNNLLFRLHSTLQLMLRL